MHQRPHRPLFAPLAMSALALAITLSGCSAGLSTDGIMNGDGGVDGAQMSTAEPIAGECAGVTVVVDFALLNSPAIDECVEVESSTPALNVLDAAGVIVTGTDAYGTAVVCRVNDLPAADRAFTVEGHDPFTETCASMPPEFAYWALWVKQGTPDWGYAMVGASDLTLSPGDSVGLVFTTGTSTPTPN